ncbi:MAG TPA: zinc-ribbon domain-containing protein [Sphingomicrobium sp.]|nr:zinc-ribbon domain-containing protein [Sphingomicrobium sp.]
MILTCPSCGTQYVVKDGTIPPEGRQVRCASCKHSWHQDPEDGGAAELVEEPGYAPAEEAVAAEAGAPVDEPAAEEEESVAEATLIEPRSGPEAEERAYEEASLDDEQEASPQVAPEESVEQAGTTYANSQFDIVRPERTSAPVAEDWKEPPQAEVQEDDFTPYRGPDEVRPKRRSPIMSILLVVVIVVVIAAAFWFLAPPELKAKLGLVGVSTSPLALVTTHMDRQRLESGNELLTVTGRVINPTGSEQQVPPLQAQLKTRAGKIVYSWTIAPPARSLAPGASASFNSAEVNVPPGGDELTITLGGGAGAG